jgi:hypothetical protein
MFFIYTHQNSKITIDTDSEIKAAQSFEEIVRANFPDKINVRWHREVTTALVRKTSNEKHPYRKGK